MNTKKLIHNTTHNNYLNNKTISKKLLRPGGQLNLYSQGEILSPNAGSTTTSSRLSPSPSVRDLISTRCNISSNRELSSSVPIESSVTNDLKSLNKMSLNELQNSSIELPSAPSVGLVLFNNEEQSDIIFLVGKDDTNLWRFPAHSFILEDASPFFKAILTARHSQNENKDNREIRINWCEHESFHVILK